MLAADPRVAYERAYPFAGHHLLFFYKFSTLLENPHLFHFLNSTHLFYLSYLGFDGEPPPYSYVPEINPENFISKDSRQLWIRNFWDSFSRNLQRDRPGSAFYAEIVPYWFSAELRQSRPCFTIYNFRDPRDVWISTKAFIARHKALAAGKILQDDQELARRIALAYVRNFENYFADRLRSDVLLVRYEDLVDDPGLIAERVKQSFGVNASLPTPQYLTTVATASDLPHSVHRWRREAPPDQVTEFLVSNLGDAMHQLGYEVPQLAHPPKHFLYFGRDGLDASTIRTSDGTLEQQNDLTVAHVHGRDFRLILPCEPFEADSVKNIWASVSSDVGEVCSVYWRSRDGRFSEERVLYSRLNPSQHWSVICFPVHTHASWKGTIYELRLDLFNMVSRGWIRRWRARYPSSKGTGRIRWIKLVA